MRRRNRILKRFNKAPKISLNSGEAPPVPLEHHHQPDSRNWSNRGKPKKRSHYIRLSRAWCKTSRWTRAAGFPWRSFGGHCGFISVWVWAQFYQDELPLLKKDLPVSITSDSYPMRSSAGKSPLLIPSSTMPAAPSGSGWILTILNFKLRPDMYVNILLKTIAAKPGRASERGCPPANEYCFHRQGRRETGAALCGIGQKIWRQLRGEERRQGRRAGGQQRQFLIDAESKVQEALKSW